MASEHAVIENVLPRIRAEYLEMPGLRLTTAQAQRLWGLDSSACDAILATLHKARFLRRLEDGTFVRFESR